MLTRKLLVMSALCAAVVADFSAPQAQAGNVNGPRASYGDVVAANGRITYTATFVAGEMAEVTIDGDGDTDLDLYVYDENGNLIDSDTDSLDFAVCRWTPKWTGAFTIVVENLGGVYNRFDIETN